MPIVVNLAFLPIEPLAAKIMISLQNSISELDRIHKSRALAVECYLTAIQCVAQYAVVINPEVTDTHRNYLTALAAEVASGEETRLQQSRATLRGLLREYRKQVALHLDGLREELSATARALQGIMDSLAQAEGDHELVLRKAVRNLREVTDSSSPSAIRLIVNAAAGQIDHGLEDLRKQHQLTVTQFQEEIGMLHRRIDSLESAARVDGLTKFLNRSEIEQGLHEPLEGACVLMIRLTGLRMAEVHFRVSVAEELAGAFAGRLRNTLPAGAIVGRWGHEEFVAIVRAKKVEALNTARHISEQLSGPYSCLEEGKAVRPTLQLSVGVAEVAGDGSAKLVERITAFFTPR